MSRAFSRDITNPMRCCRSPKKVVAINSLLTRGFHTWKQQDERQLETASEGQPLGEELVPMEDFSAGVK